MIQYRKLRRNDIQQVQVVALKAWRYTYRHIYKLSTINKYVTEYYSNESFKEFTLPRIRKGDDVFYLALDGRRVIGYSHVGERIQRWELFRIYLLPEFVGKVIGKKLLHLGERFLRRKGARSYYLYVHARNSLGRQFHLRNGFERVKEKDRGPTSQCLQKRLD